MIYSLNGWANWNLDFFKHPYQAITGRRTSKTIDIFDVNIWSIPIPFLSHSLFLSLHTLSSFLHNFQWESELFAVPSSTSIAFWTHMCTLYMDNKLMVSHIFNNDNSIFHVTFYFGNGRQNKRKTQNPDAEWYICSILFSTRITRILIFNKQTTTKKKPTTTPTKHYEVSSSLLSILCMTHTQTAIKSMFITENVDIPYSQELCICFMGEL